MIAEVGKNKKVSKSAESVNHPPGLKPSSMKNQYQSLTEDEEDEWIVRESEEVTQDTKVFSTSSHQFARIRRRSGLQREKFVRFANESKLELTVVQQKPSAPRDGQASSRWKLLSQEKH